MPQDGAANSADLTSFLDALRDSRLLDPSELSQYESSTDPDTVAEQLIRRGSLTPYQILELRRGSGDRLVLGQYILLEPLGEGGMGQVFKARHQKMRRIVALKVIRKEAAANAEALKRFGQEIEAAAQLSHPNVIQAYDANEVDDVHFFVMEYVEGTDLSQLVKRLGKRPVPLACDYIRQAALGLQHAHERGLVHRDIKPSNLLLTYQTSIVKILDLGLARLRLAGAEGTGHLTATGTVMGTPDYIAPEQARDSRGADIRSDLYSLGCSMYYLLAGQPPFPDGNFTEKLLKHTLDPPPSLTKFCPEIPPAVEAIVTKLLAKNPEDRFQTPAELADALAPFAQKEATADYLRPSVTDRSNPSPTGLVVVPLARAPEKKTESWPSEKGKGVSKTDPSPPSRAARPSSSPTPLRTPPRTDPPRSLTLPTEGQAPEWDSFTATAPATTAPPPPVPAPRRPRSPTATLLLGAVVGLLLVVVVLAAVVIFKVLPTSGQPVVVVPANTHPADQGTASAGPSPSSPVASIIVPPSTSVAPSTPSGPPTTRMVPPTTRKDPVEPPPPPPPPPPIRTGALLTTRYPTEKGKLVAAFSPDGKWLVAGAGPIVQRWDLHADRADLPQPVKLELWGYPLESLTVDNDGRVLVGATREWEDNKVDRPFPTVALWEPGRDLRSEPDRMYRHPQSNKPIATAVFVGANAFLSTGPDPTIRFWDANKSNTELQPMKKHAIGVDAIAVSDDGLRALSGGRDNKVCVWDLDTHKHLASLDGHTKSVTCVAFAPEGHTAVSTDFDKMIFVWDVDKAMAIRSFPAGDDVVHCLVVAPDGASFLTGANDGMVRWWSMEGEQLMKPYDQHHKPILAIAFSGDGKYAISYGADQVLRRWELAKGK
jgi:serine/threonine protein kinase